MAVKDFYGRKPTLETDRLILRPLVPGDAAALEKWLPDPELYTYWGRPANPNELHPNQAFIDPRPLIDRRADPNFRWGIVFNPEGALIGDIFLTGIENNRMAKVAYRVSRRYHGRGIATEALGCVVRFAFDETELQRLWTDVDERNVASQRVLEKCGFRCEGHIRQGKMVQSWCDYRIYGLLREDISQ